MSKFMAWLADDSGFVSTQRGLPVAWVAGCLMVAAAVLGAPSAAGADTCTEASTYYTCSQTSDCGCPSGPCCIGGACGPEACDTPGGGGTYCVCAIQP